MNYKNNGKMSYQLIYENHILLLHKLLRNNCFTLHLNGMPEELEPAVSINHHHTDEGPDISRQRYTSEHYTVMIQQLMCLPDIYIYIFFFIIFSEQILQQKDLFTFKSHNYLTARNGEGKMAILDSNDHIIHMQTNRVYNKDVCYSRELFSCLRLTLSQGEEARVGD